MNIKLSIAAGLLAFLLPGTAFAYLAPSQVFGGTNLNQMQAPPTAREAADVVTAREKAIAARRAAEQSKLSSTEDEDDYDDYVEPENPNTPCLDDECQYALRQERLKAAAGSQGGPTIIIGADGSATVYGSNGSVLHSGAPLVTATGPASVVAGLVTVLALLLTLGYVRYRSSRAAGRVVIG